MFELFFVMLSMICKSMLLLIYNRSFLRFFVLITSVLSTKDEWGHLKIFLSRDYSMEQEKDLVIMTLLSQWREIYRNYDIIKNMQLNFSNKRVYWERWRLYLYRYNFLNFAYYTIARLNTYINIRIIYLRFIENATFFQQFDLRLASLYSLI